MRSTSRSRSRDLEQAASSESGPGVPSIIETMDEDRSGLMTGLRDIALSLPSVAERTLYDGFCRHWTPAYYLGENQLFHVHDFRAGLRATVFVGGKELGPLILESDRVQLDLRLQLSENAGLRRIRQIKVSLSSDEDVAALMELARLKWHSLQ